MSLLQEIYNSGDAASLPIMSYAFGAAEGLANDPLVWPDAFGVENLRAVLIRPDGFVAWRSRHAPLDSNVPEKCSKTLGFNCAER